jgi:hypothetical protein
MRQAVRDAKRACERGLGPPKHAVALPVEHLHELPAGPWPGCQLRNPGAALLCGAWRLTREIELSNALVRDIQITPTGVTWNLPASKADPRALGEHRTHLCA